MVVLPERAPGMAVTTTTAGRLTSQTAQEATWLSVLLDIRPDDPLVGILAGRLDKARRNGQWASTLNNAAVIAALARYQTMTREEKPQFTGSIRAESGKEVSFDHTEPVSAKFDNLAGPIEIAASGSGTVYVAVSTEGLAKEGLVEPYNRQLFVQRRWLGRDRKPVDRSSLQVGDLIQVELEIRSTGHVSNIAIVDALPGGMEVEHPRLATSAKPGWPGGARPDHVEFLDDRVVLFCSAGNGNRVFRYALRVISAGDFALPQIQASCMYDPGVASLGRAGRVEISR